MSTTSRDAVEPGLVKPQSRQLEELGAMDADVKDTPSEPAPNANIFSHGGENYRIKGRTDTIFILYTNQFGLGIPSLPSALRTLGLISEIIAIFGIGCITWNTAYELLQYCAAHLNVVNIADMTRVLGGTSAQAIFNILIMIQIILFSASTIVTLSIAFNINSEHSACITVYMLSEYKL